MSVCGEEVQIMSQHGVFAFIYLIINALSLEQMKIVYAIKGAGSQDSQVIVSDLVILQFLYVKRACKYIVTPYLPCLGQLGWLNVCMWHPLYSWPKFHTYFSSGNIASGYIAVVKLAVLFLVYKAALISFVTLSKSLSLCDHRPFDKLGQTIYPLHLIRFY